MLNCIHIGISIGIGISISDEFVDDYDHEPDHDNKTVMKNQTNGKGWAKGRLGLFTDQTGREGRERERILVLALPLVAV